MGASAVGRRVAGFVVVLDLLWQPSLARLNFDACDPRDANLRDSKRHLRR